MHLQVKFEPHEERQRDLKKAKAANKQRKDTKGTAEGTLCMPKTQEYTAVARRQQKYRYSLQQNFMHA